MKKKKCWPLFHDWEIIRTVTEYRLKEDLKEELNKTKYDGYELKGKFTFHFVEKICMKCETYVDEISPQMDKIRIDHFTKIQHKKMADERAIRAKNILDKIKRDGRK